ncbi:O-antigen ligase family protein [Elioraea sp.]|uniref:O-antigen ligase family protein n=1 Tax=Elioraea sp. TaxID=2185103 RepID=UPI00307DC0F5
MNAIGERRGASSNRTGAPVAPHRRPRRIGGARRLLAAAGTLIAILWVLHAVGLDTAWSGFTILRAPDLAVMLGLLAANFALVSARLLVLLRQFGWRVGGWAALRATAAGQAADLVVFQLVGQVVGRQVVLRASGITPAVTTAATVYERAILFAVAAGFGLAGALHVFGRAAVAELVAGVPWAEAAIAGAGALVLALWSTAGPRERNALRRMVRPGRLAGAFAATALTAIGQALVIASFVVGLRAAAPQTDMLSLVAAAAVVSFAAGLPISVNGWGVREVAAIHVFGLLGVPAGQALAVSVAVGVCAAAIVLGAAPLALSRTAADGAVAAHASASDRGAEARPGEAAFTRMIVWLLMLAVSVLVFFQVPIPLMGSVTTVNLADPFALVALALFGLHWFAARRPPPWRGRALGTWMLLAAAAMGVAFLIGVARFGVTPWALGNRLTGLALLAGYLSVGALAVGGKRALRQLVQMLLLAAATVTVVHLCARIGTAAGWFEIARLPPNFEAYAGNRNAYAFQMLVVATVAAAYATVWARGRRAILSVLPMAMVLLGVWLSQSRAGLVTAAALVLLAFVSGRVHRRSLAQALVAAAISVGVITIAPLLPAILDHIGSSFVSGLSKPAAVVATAPPAAVVATAPPAPVVATAPPPALQPVSDGERWESLTRGLGLWLDHPLFGAGLGAFVHGHLVETGTPLVIHNTLLWLLAEFGAVGTLPWLGLFLGAVLVALRHLDAAGSRWAVALLGVLGCFALFSLVHDILYQRVLWLLLGALLALPQAAAEQRSTPQAPRPKG